MMISGPLVRYILTAARRDRLVLTLALMIFLGAALSAFLGSAAMIEQGQFSLVFASGGLRVLGVLGLVLFVCFYMRRAFEHKEVEFLLSRPISRLAFLLSHAAAFIILSFFIAVLVAAPLFFTGAPHMGGLAVWALSVAVEYAIMAVTALFFAVALSSAAGSALAALGFYVLARLVGTLIGIAAGPADHPVLGVLARVLDVISVVIPRLDLMGQTSWLVYGVGGSGGLALMNHAGAYAQSMVEHLGVTGFVFAQGVVFICLLCAASAFDFIRRRF